MKVRLLTMMMVATINASATNYYLSSKGNDMQSGTSAIAPWRSLKRLSEAMHLLQPGDSILFERGSIFNGEMKISASGKPEKAIYFGSYGAGSNPIINGAVEVSNWTPYKANIWVADCIDCPTTPKNLFIDGHYQPFGRYPNDGYMAFTCNSECKTSFTDNHHSFANGYWDGAEVVVKSSRWTMDNLPVVTYFNKTFYCSAAASYPLPNGYGYFIQNHISTLDRQGEWFFDKLSGKVFLYQDTDSPRSHSIEVSAIDLGLEMSNSAFITMENISFKYQQKLGVQINYSTRVTLRNCHVEYAGDNGMEINSCQDPLIERCHVENSNNNGVIWFDNTNGSFVRNFIRCTGLQPGRGSSGNGTYIGLSISGNKHPLGKNMFQFNSIDSTGYLGIDFRTGGTSILNNMVSHFCMIKDDGAGIYTWGNTYADNKVEGNIVLHGIGNGSGTNDPDQAWVSGIYIDDRSADISLANNTVAYCNTNGIYIHNARRITIHNNTLFANGCQQAARENAQLCIKRDALVPILEGESLDLHIAGNRFVTFREGNHCVYLRAEKEQHLRGLEFDSNLYVAPYPPLAIAKLFDHQEMCNAIEELTLPDWLQTGCDRNSQFVLIDKSNEPIGNNLVRNARMTTNTDGWTAWPAQVHIAHDKQAGDQAPSLKVLFPSAKIEALLYYAGISLSNSKWYRLSFSAKSITESKLEFVPLMASAPWEALGDYACFSLDTNFKSFTYFFRPHTGNKLARLNFKSNSSFWIDNVTLSEAGSKTETTTESVQLFYNADERPKTISLPKTFRGADGNLVAGKIVVQGYDSRILLGNR